MGDLVLEWQLRWLCQSLSSEGDMVMRLVHEVAFKQNII